jgi:nitrous oxidase accessory protein NosD
MLSRFLVAALASLLMSCLFDQTATQAAEVFNVKNFGATGDGSTDDTVALTAAFTAANASPRSELVFPAGTYVFTGTLQANRIDVVGRQATLSGTSNEALITLTGEGVSISHFTISKPNGGPVLSVTGASRFVITGNQFMTKAGIQMSKSSLGFIEHNTFSLPKFANGIRADRMTSTIIEDNRFLAVQDRPSGRGIYITNSTDDVIMGNDFQFFQYAIFMASNNKVYCKRNTFTNSATAIFSLLDVGCEISKNTLMTGTSGIDSAGAQRQVINANNFESIARPLRVTGGVQTSFLENIITNSTEAIDVIQCGQAKVDSNTFNNVGGGALLRDCTNSEVSSNHINNCNTQGIVERNNKGSSTVANNILENCGLSITKPPAAIYVNNPDAAITITDNTYRGDPGRLFFFIWCEQRTAKISGNRTNTMLPDHTGP